MGVGKEFRTNVCWFLTDNDAWITVLILLGGGLVVVSGIIMVGYLVGLGWAVFLELVRATGEAWRGTT